MKMKQKNNMKNQKSKSWFFGKINNIERPLAQLTKRKKEDSH